MSGFDFFRRQPSDWEPRTPGTSLRGVGTGLLAAEHFVFTSTSVRPLDEEPWDIEAVERMAERTDLPLSARLLVKGIFEKLASSRDPEAALAGAEGINALESRHLVLVGELKVALAAVKDPGRLRTLRILLARQYHELGELHGRASSIGRFYLRQAIACLRASLGGERVRRDELALLVEVLIDLGLHDGAAAALQQVAAPKDAQVLQLTARVSFHRRDWQRVAACCRLLRATSDQLPAEVQQAVAFWSGDG